MEEDGREEAPVADDESELHLTENGMEVEDEQEVPCNGEGDANKEKQEDSASVVVKKEPVENIENSLEGLQQMLGYNIDEEVGKQKENGGEKKKKKRQLSEGSDPDGHGKEVLTSSDSIYFTFKTFFFC